MSSDKVLWRQDAPHGQGDVTFAWQSGAKTNYLATTGSDATIAIFNRQGQLQERIVLQGPCCGFSWDCDGDLLAIITSNISHITVWDTNARKKQLIDSGLRDAPSFLLWSKKNQVLAVATTRGNLALYNHQTAKRIPVLGKHSKRITSGAWNTDNILALGSDDKTVSISNDDGDTLRTIQLRDTPSDLNFAEMKTDERVPGENTISMILGKRTLFLYHLPEPDSPTELGFQNRYGSLIEHKWYGDGYILLGFAGGYIVAISTHAREVGQELWQVKNHRDSLSSIAISKELELVASCGDNNVKIHAMSNLQETIRILTVADQAGLKNIGWSTDGQLLAVTCNQGSISIFVTKLHSLYAVSAPRIALLSSLAEVAIYHYIPDKNKTPMPTTVVVEIEPTFIAIGPYHLACGMNNHVWFYDIGRSSTDTPLLLGDREYMAEIKQIQLNTDYCAVLCGSQIMLHTIENITSANNSSTLAASTSQDREPKIFPDELQGLRDDIIITCLNLTNEFLCFGTDTGNLVHFSLEQWNSVIFRHTIGIKSIFTDMDGTRVCFIDDHNQSFVYLPYNEETILIPNTPKHIKGILWDFSHPSVFVAFDDKVCVTYIFVRHSVGGKCVRRIGETKLMSDHIPLMIYDGDLCLQNCGKLTSIALETHKTSSLIEPDEQLKQLVGLQKYQDAFELCKTLNDKDELWNVLGSLCVNDLEINFAIRVYRKTGNVAMVQALEDIRFIEDINVLAGHCAILLNLLDEAKQMFSKSSHPLEALELCRDLLQWEQAMALSNNLAQEQFCFIAREYAQQLELAGNYIEALVNYERAIEQFQDQQQSFDELLDNHLQLGKAGIARTTIRCGNFTSGIKIASELNDKQLYNDCADALEKMNQLTEAAELYEKSEKYDKACGIYIQLKNWTRVDKILHNVTSLKLYAVHAKAKEAEGKYREAIKSFQLAHDLDNVIRIYLEHLADPHSASEIVLECRSVEGGKLLAKFYKNVNDYESAIQFLVICGCVSDAFQLAQKHNKLKHYGELLEQYDGAKPKDFLELAKHFENEKYTLLTGKYYFHAKEYSKSLKLLLKASTFGSDEQQSLSFAIDCVATSNDDKLASQLIEFLLGEIDGKPKDPKLLFRLYMARKQYREASKSSVIIANQEQVAGNYRNAHNLLFTMYQELKRNNLTVASDMKLNLMLLHRYILVRIHVKQGQHLQAARLLVEVAKNISQFPAHVVPILTSTVIECQRAGLKKSAFTYAVVLMRSDYREQIDSKYVKKIESIVRKAPKNISQMTDYDDDLINNADDNGGDDKEDQLKKSTNNRSNDSSPCPICNKKLFNMDVMCTQCKNLLPFCIASGQHLTNEFDICLCPECEFPAIKTELVRILELNNHHCPMCNQQIDINRLQLVTDLPNHITQNNN